MNSKRMPFDKLKELISTKTMTAAMTSAGAKTAKYKAPNKK